MNKNEYGISKFRCNKENETYTYDFVNDGLNNLSHKFTYNRNDLENFDDIYDSYMSLSNDITKLGGVAVINNNTDSFYFESQIDLNYFNIIGNTNYNYYSLNTKPKIIYFEMEAKGFDCNEVQF